MPELTAVPDQPAPLAEWLRGSSSARSTRADTRARRLRVTRRGAGLARRAIAAVEQVDAEFFADVARTPLSICSAGSPRGPSGRGGGDEFRPAERSIQ